MSILPLEEVDPELANYFMQISQKKLNAVVHNTRVFEKTQSGRLKEVVDSNIITIGRNDPCLCGSGKKFKKCCGK